MVRRRGLAAGRSGGCGAGRWLTAAVGRSRRWRRRSGPKPLNPGAQGLDLAVRPGRAEGEAAPGNGGRRACSATGPPWSPGATVAGVPRPR